MASKIYPYRMWTRRFLCDQIYRMPLMHNFPVINILDMYDMETLKEELLVKGETKAGVKGYRTDLQKFLMFMNVHYDEIKGRIDEIYEYSKTLPTWDHTYDGRAVMRRGKGYGKGHVDPPPARPDNGGGHCGEGDEGVPAEDGSDGDNLQAEQGGER